MLVPTRRGYGETLNKERQGSLGNAEYVLRRARVPLGFAFAAAFLFFARPSWRSLVCSLALVVPGLALRAYAAGYVKKNSELTTTGPYAHTRNPLYLGSFLAALGFAAASRSVVLLVCFLLLFFAVYLPVIRSEERFLAGFFPEFPAYMRRVPRLFPRRGRVQVRSAAAFSVERYLHHREYNSVVGAFAVYAALVLLLVLRGRGFLPQ